MPKNLNGPLGPVTLKSNRGEDHSFSSIEQAAELIRKGRLTLIEHPLPPRIGEDWIGLLPLLHILLDDCGLIIPLWRVARAVEALSPTPCRYRRFRDYDPETDFRNGPISGTGRRRFYGRYLRHMKTHRERRDIFGLENDLRDAEEFPVRVKIRASRKALPTLWDDVPHARRGDGWKNYRKTQYARREASTPD